MSASLGVVIDVHRDYERREWRERRVRASRALLVALQHSYLVFWGGRAGGHSLGTARSLTLGGEPKFRNGRFLNFWEGSVLDPFWDPWSQFGS